MNQLVVTALVERWGYQLDISPNGAHALDAIGATRYDLVLIECVMAAMDGYETSARIRGMEEPTRHIPIIGLSAQATGSARQRCLDAGMDDYVCKPLDPSALKEALARCHPRKIGLVAPDSKEHG
jgi:two-component system, sensor histidine kinase and response regulator